MVNVVGYILLGISAGIISGLFGIGGAIIVVPSLVFFFKFTQHQAQGTSLAMLLLPVGLLAVLRYYKSGHVNIQVAAIIAAAFVVGGLLGAQWAEKISAIWLQRLFGGLLLVVALKMIFSK